MITAASNPLLSRFKSKLPESYQTLYELHKLNKVVSNDRFIELIESADIHPEMSKANVSSLRKTESPKMTDVFSEETTVSEIAKENKVVSADFERSEPVKISTLDEMKSAYDALDEKTKTEFAANLVSCFVYLFYTNCGIHISCFTHNRTRNCRNLFLLTLRWTARNQSKC